jgi:hypothetical protein
VLRILSELGIPVQGNTQPHQALSYGLRLTGEIDALAAAPQRSRLWVCEVKDVSLTVSPRTIASRVAEFTEPDGYISKLLRSAREVRANPAAAARLLDVAESGRSWEVLPLMITRFVEPAAFTPQPAVTFVMVEDLASVIHGDVKASSGHVHR